MLLHHSLLLLHLVGVMLLVGGVGASLACKLAASRSTSPRVIQELVQVASRSIRVVSMPGSLLLLVAGLGLIHVSDGAYSLSEPWIIGAILAWIASGAVGARMHAPRSRATRELALDLEAAGRDATRELHELIHGGRVATSVDIALLMAMVTLMVFKPG